MNYGMNIKVRSENCQINGTRESADNAKAMAAKTGELDFTQSEAVNSATLSLKTGDTEQIYYFETTIKNLDEQPTNVSLYLKSIPNTKFGLGVASPSNSYHVFNAAQQDVCIVRNAFIKGSADEKYHDLKVVWFIRAAGSVTIDFTKLYLRYN